jgi:outer membrane immunogenic protein
MKKHLLAGCAAAALLTALTSAQLTSANAADLSRPVPAPYYKAPAMVAPAFSWTGLYLGLQGGYGWGHESYADNIFGPVSHSPQGGIFGGVLGYRYQIGQFVLGVEGDWDWADITKSGVNAVGPYSTRTDDIATVRARAGFAIDRALFYVTGGYAGADTQLTINGFGSQSEWRSGGVIGGGLEYAFTNNISAKAEYLFAPLQSQSFDGAKSDVDLSMVRAGLNYKF